MVVGRWKREAGREVEWGCGRGSGNTFQLAGLGITIGIGSSVHPWFFVLSTESGKVGNGGESNGTNHKRQVLSSTGPFQPGLVVPGKLKSLPLCPIVINILRSSGQGRGHKNTRACRVPAPSPASKVLRLRNCISRKYHRIGRADGRGRIVWGVASGSLLRKCDLQDGRHSFV